MTPGEKRVRVKDDGGEWHRATRRRGEDRYARVERGTKIDRRDGHAQTQALASTKSFWGLDESVRRKERSASSFGEK